MGSRVSGCQHGSVSEQEAVPGPRTSVIVAGARTPFGRLSDFVTQVMLR